MSILVLINGNPSREFGLEKGLRQGDSLSPFLFNVVVEGLSVLFRKAADLDLVKGMVLIFICLPYNLQMTQFFSFNLRWSISRTLDVF